MDWLDRSKGIFQASSFLSWFHKHVGPCNIRYHRLCSHFDETPYSPPCFLGKSIGYKSLGEKERKRRILLGCRCRWRQFYMFNFESKCSISMSLSFLLIQRTGSTRVSSVPQTPNTTNAFANAFQKRVSPGRSVSIWPLLSNS